MEHELKIDWPNLDEVIAGAKTHEVRVNDRDYRVGDRLFLRGFCRDRKLYNGTQARVSVTNITKGNTYGLPANLCVMSIRLLSYKRD